jgi:signal transduction histidine kinase
MPPTTPQVPVLVVDDSPAICRTIAEALLSHGFDVTTVNSGLDAIAAIKKRKFHLVTLDVEMPGMAGIDVLRIIKVFDPDLFVIMVSGLSALQTALAAIRQGAYDYISKPFDPEDMILSVQRALQQRSLVLENRKLIDDLRMLNENLEALVVQRTKELERAHEELLRNHDELEKTYTRLKDLDELKTKFITIASHELRTPLTAISGFAGLLTSGRIAPEKQQRAIESLEKNVKRLIAIVSEITDIARLRDKKLCFSKEPVDVSELIRSVAQEMQPFVEQRRMALQLRTSEGLQVEADPSRIRQVLMHLLLNAIRFTPDKGTIEISSLRENGTLRISIHDTGIGIEEGEMARIFDEFYESAPYQYHHSGTIQFQSGGIGLGLAVVKGIIEEHGGRIWVESERSRGGSGSTFHFTLPVS